MLLRSSSSCSAPAFPRTVPQDALSNQKAVARAAEQQLHHTADVVCCLAVSADITDLGGISSWTQFWRSKAWSDVTQVANLITKQNLANEVSCEVGIVPGMPWLLDGTQSCASSLWASVGQFGLLMVDKSSLWHVVPAYGTVPASQAWGHTWIAL